MTTRPTIAPYCRGCGYEPASEIALEQFAKGYCLCPPDMPAGRELEPSAREPGMGFAAGFNAERAEDSYGWGEWDHLPKRGEE